MQIIDIVGQVCPFAALSAKKEMNKMKSGDSIIIKLDCSSAATETIPEIAKSLNIKVGSKKVDSGTWELTLTR